MLDRRSFLARTGAALAVSALPSPLLAAVRRRTPPPHDPCSPHESIRFAAARAGARARRGALYDRPAAADAGGIAERLRRAIAPATRAVGVTWVHSSTGVRLPIPAIAQVVAEANRGRAEADRVTLVVDGVHGLGAVDESVAALGCDFFCAGTHKWMFAPRGTGLVWGRAEHWAKLAPVIPTFANADVFERWKNDDRSSHPTTAYDMSPGGFHAYEHEWAMSAAFQFHQRMGRS